MKSQKNVKPTCKGKNCEDVKINKHGYCKSCFMKRIQKNMKKQGTVTEIEKGKLKIKSQSVQPPKFVPEIKEEVTEKRKKEEITLTEVQRKQVIDQLRNNLIDNLNSYEKGIFCKGKIAGTQEVISGKLTVNDLKIAIRNIEQDLLNSLDNSLKTLELNGKLSIYSLLLPGYVIKDSLQEKKEKEIIKPSKKVIIPVEKEEEEEDEFEEEEEEDEFEEEEEEDEFEEEEEEDEFEEEEEEEDEFEEEEEEDEFEEEEEEEDEFEEEIKPGKKFSKSSKKEEKKSGKKLRK
jgi:ribosomal protein S8